MNTKLMIINRNHCLSLSLSSWRRGQKVCTAHPLCGQRTKARRGDGGSADAIVPLDMRQSCNVDHQTCFLCVKPLSYTQRHSKAVQRFLGPERAFMVFSWGTLKHAAMGCHPTLCFKPSGSQLGENMLFFLIEKLNYYGSCCFSLFVLLETVEMPLNHLLLTPAVVAFSPTDVSSVLSWLVSLSHHESSE